MNTESKDESNQVFTEAAKDIEVKATDVDPKEEAIKEKVAELKKEHNIKEVFVITSEDKTAYLKRPSRAQMKYATQVAQGNILELAEQVLRSGWLEGDKEIIDDDYHFYGVTDQVEKILETATAELKKY